MNRPPLRVFLPLLLFVGLVGLALGGLYWGRGDDLPSTLIGQQAPDLPVEGLPGKRLVTDTDLRDGELTLVNFWASWCPPCRLEHPTLLSLKEEGFRVVGVNFRDDADRALGYLADEGDPFMATGFDPRGRVSIDWGVTAPPETFIVDGNGTVLFRFAGPLIDADYENRFLPALREAMSR